MDRTLSEMNNDFNFQLTHCQGWSWYLSDVTRWNINDIFFCFPSCGTRF